MSDVQCFWQLKDGHGRGGNGGIPRFLRDFQARGEKVEESALALGTFPRFLRRGISPALYQAGRKA